MHIDPAPLRFFPPRGRACDELSLNFGDGLAGQAAAVMGWRSVGLAMTSIPSLNVTPRTSFGNWLWPSRRRQLFCAASSSLKTIASAANREKVSCSLSAFAGIPLKACMGATHFLTKTLPKVAAEMALSVLAYNLTRVMNIVGTKPLMAAIVA